MNHWLSRASVLLMIILGFSIGLAIIHNSYFNHIETIDDRKEVVTRTGESIPTMITFHHRAWGTVTIRDELHLQRIAASFSQISERGTLRKKVKVIKGDFHGTITYLNGSVKAFSLGDRVVVDHYLYRDDNVMAIAASLKAALLSLCYTPKKIASFVKHAQSVTEHKEHIRLLPSNKVDELSTEIHNATLIEDYDQITRLMLKYKKPQAIYHISFHGKKGRKRTDVLSLSLYPEFVIAQYLGDDNGNVVYLRRSLDRLNVKGAQL
ncbi:hypothetical protein A374_14025 [Fictibacillus macauensis ZFHKF-1]|uniref:DUF3919 family protein n=1 Tax=Fictibacillus macauensis ZFHKF-1 TaxID=1196324 RepID=I8UD12_9BACL|nr:DUF3919 family protein [Fictibacillus macauensis]EIT84815.1 hypothetical protein A374_14025 [Fictibacillus macauensis ZFHKF-1]